VWRGCDENDDEIEKVWGSGVTTQSGQTTVMNVEVAGMMIGEVRMTSHRERMTARMGRSKSKGQRALDSPRENPPPRSRGDQPHRHLILGRSFLNIVGVINIGKGEV
jgi:hypothetical protein